MPDGVHDKPCGWHALEDLIDTAAAKSACSLILYANRRSAGEACRGRPQLHGSLVGRGRSLNLRSSSRTWYCSVGSDTTLNSWLRPCSRASCCASACRHTHTATASQPPATRAVAATVSSGCGQPAYRAAIFARAFGPCLESSPPGSEFNGSETAKAKWTAHTKFVMHPAS